jgi:hypothetical protein
LNSLDAHEVNCKGKVTKVAVGENNAPMIVGDHNTLDNTTNFFIVVSDFGTENRAKIIEILGPDFLSSAIKARHTTGIPDTIDGIHNNPHLPEFHNVSIGSIRRANDQRARVVKGGKVVDIPLRDAIDCMVKTGSYVLQDAATQYNEDDIDVKRLLKVISDLKGMLKERDRSKVFTEATQFIEDEIGMTVRQKAARDRWAGIAKQREEEDKKEMNKPKTTRQKKARERTVSLVKERMKKYPKLSKAKAAK